jgi:hypothetical protein
VLGGDERDRRGARVGPVGGIFADGRNGNSMLSSLTDGIRIDGPSAGPTLRGDGPCPSRGAGGFCQFEGCGGVGRGGYLVRTPRSKLDIAREGLDAYRRRDVEPCNDLSCDDAELYTLTEGVTEVEPFPGHAGIAQWIDTELEPWDDFGIQPTEFREVGDDRPGPQLSAVGGALQAAVPREYK